ncbi:polysaccharide deacetylase [Lachnospiraceae bacterium KM106-2]|nr:polysaccharide deacetylase [Lachnospiraceae bacterium KM106-2]
MCDKLTIVMYHYVRDLKDSRYPNIKGLDLDLFDQQLDFIEKNYNVVTMEQVIAATQQDSKETLPQNPILLTFDDGYSDHFINVFPKLHNRGMQGSFFVSARAIEEDIVMNVNKIHYILANAPIQQLVKDVFALLDKYRKEGYDLKPTNELYSKLAIASRFDDKDTIFVKRLLQNEINEEVRSKMADELLEKYVDISQKVLSKELYLNMEQIRCMKKAGMFFGIHAYEHYWLGKIPKDKMESDIDRALDYFDEVIDRDNWVMNYPYGSYNDDVIAHIKKRGCKLGLGTGVRIADLSKDDRFTLPRLDTNDLPPKSENYKKL